VLIERIYRNIDGSDETRKPVNFCEAERPASLSRRWASGARTPVADQREDYDDGGTPKELDRADERQRLVASMLNQTALYLC
jgi:hypothetical protein